MAIAFIYSIKQIDDAQLDYPGQTRIQTTRKHVATQFLAKQLEEGVSLSEFEVTRSRDGRPDTLTYVDVYDFMNIDLGEAL